MKLPFFELNTGTKTVSDTLVEFRKTKDYQTMMDDIENELKEELSESLKGCSTCSENPINGPCPPDCRSPSWNHWIGKCDVKDSQGNHCPGTPTNFIINNGKICHLCRNCHKAWLDGAWNTKKGD